jgi:hypothetical protein
MWINAGFIQIECYSHACWRYFHKHTHNTSTTTMKTFPGLRQLSNDSVSNPNWTVGFHGLVSVFHGLFFCVYVNVHACLVGDPLLFSLFSSDSFQLRGIGSR